MMMMIMMVMIISMSGLQKVVHPGSSPASQAGQRSRQHGVEVSAAAAWWGLAQPATRAAHLVNASGGGLQLFSFIICWCLFDLFPIIISYSSYIWTLETLGRICEN